MGHHRKLLQASLTSPTPLTETMLAEVDRTSDTQRFRISSDGLRIRANQGHSLAMDLGLPARVPPVALYHGTANRWLGAILATGLQKQNRHHAHLLNEFATAYQVGSRHDPAVVLAVASGVLHERGHTFYCSDNCVWLTEHLPTEFLQQLDAR